MVSISMLTSQHLPWMHLLTLLWLQPTHLGQLILAIPLRVGAISTGENCGTPFYALAIVLDYPWSANVSWCRLKVMEMEISATLWKLHGSGRTFSLCSGYSLPSQCTDTVDGQLEVHTACEVSHCTDPCNYTFGGWFGWMLVCS